MVMHKMSPSVDYNQWLKRLDTNINEPTNHNVTKVIKVIKQTMLLINIWDVFHGKMLLQTAKRTYMIKLI